MKIETHVHTAESSPCANADARSIVKAYAEAGYDALIITDHFDEGLLRDYDPNRIERYLRGYRAALKAGEEFGIWVWLGMEIRLEPDAEDFLIFGIDEQFLFDNPGMCLLSQRELYELCHAHGALLFQAHPFRAPCKPRDAAWLDGMEFNQRPDGGNRNKLLEGWMLEHPALKCISGSDCHALSQVGYGGVEVDCPLETVQQFAETLWRGDYRLIQLENNDI